MHRRASSFWLALLLLFSTSAAWAETYFQSALKYIETGRETEARRALQREIAVRPRNLEARYDLAVLLERIGHDKQAAELYRENLRLGRHLPSVVNLSSFLRRHHKLNEAEALLRSATKKYRSEAVPWYLLAEIAAERHNLQSAEEDFRNALRADRKNGFAHLRYARFLAAEGRIKAAEKQARLSIQLLPDCAPCQRIAGDILMRAGEKRQALHAWQRSMALAPDVRLRDKILGALKGAR